MTLEQNINLIVRKYPYKDSDELFRSELVELARVAREEMLEEEVDGYDLPKDKMGMDKHEVAIFLHGANWYRLCHHEITKQQRIN